MGWGLLTGDVIMGVSLLGLSKRPFRLVGFSFWNSISVSLRVGFTGSEITFGDDK